jgi:hypothetical protein
LSESSKKTATDSTHPDIQEILAKRRETLNRVREDLRKVDQLQSDFWRTEEKRLAERKELKP